MIKATHISILVLCITTSAFGGCRPSDWWALMRGQSFRAVTPEVSAPQPQPAPAPLARKEPGATRNWLSGFFQPSLEKEFFNRPNVIQFLRSVGFSRADSHTFLERTAHFPHGKALQEAISSWARKAATELGLPLPATERLVVLGVVRGVSAAEALEGMTIPEVVTLAKAMPNSADRVIVLSRFVARRGSTLDGGDLVNVVRAMDQSSSARDSTLVAYVFHYSATLTPSGALAVARAINSSASTNIALEGYAKAHYATLVAKDLGRLATASPSGSVCDRILSEYMPIAALRLSSAEAVTLAGIAHSSRMRDWLTETYAVAHYGTMEMTDAKRLSSAAWSNAVQGRILVGFFAAAKAKISTDDAISLAAASGHADSRDTIVEHYAKFHRGTLKSSDVRRLAGAAYRSSTGDRMRKEFSEAATDRLSPSELLSLATSASASSTRNAILSGFVASNGARISTREIIKLAGAFSSASNSDSTLSHYARTRFAQGGILSNELQMLANAANSNRTKNEILSLR